MKSGIVKWYRHDGAGYLYTQDNPECSILFDASSLTSKYLPNKGDIVDFESEVILGREIAVQVKLKGDIT